MRCAKVSESKQQIGDVHKQDPFDISNDMEQDVIGNKLDEEGQGVGV